MAAYFFKGEEEVGETQRDVCGGGGGRVGLFLAERYELKFHDILKYITFT